MSDDVDDRVRRALASLDGQAPDDYFDTLAARTLARLDEAPAELAADEPVGDDAVIGEARDEDSGLQDIRSLADEAKARLRRSSQEVIARPEASATWRALAQPAPRRTGELGAATGPGAGDSMTGPASGQGAGDSMTGALTGEAGGASVGAIDELARQRALRVAPPSATPPVPVRGRRTVAAAALAVAAAAGALIFVSSGDRASAPQVSSSEAPRTITAAQDRASPDPVAAGYAGNMAGSGSASTASSGSASTASSGSASAGSASADRRDAAGRYATKGASATEKPARPSDTLGSFSKAKPGGGAKRKSPSKLAPPPDDDAPPPAAKPAAAPAGKPPAPSQGSDEPSFDELVKQANIAPPKQAATKYGKPALTADDIKRGMAAVAPAAERCSVGTAGLASVRLTVAPSGQITKVTITGPFAGTPVAACVERAVRTARFPPWDGGPQSFGYSYLLPE